MGELNTREARIRRACYLHAMGHATAEIASALKTTNKAVLHMLKQDGSPELVKEFQEAQETGLLQEQAAQHNDHIARFQSLAPRAVDLQFKLIEKGERGELSDDKLMKLVQDTLDRVGLPRQTAQTVRHSHMNAPVNNRTLVVIGEFGKELLESGALENMDFRALGQRLASDEDNGEVIEVESKSQPADAVGV